jgi:hypothetical protein
MKFFKVLIPALVATIFAWSAGSGDSSSSSNEEQRVDPIPAGQSVTHVPLYPQWWGKAPIIEAGTACKEPGSCGECHESQREMDPVHAFPCIRCHGGNSYESDKDKAHSGLIPDPGDLSIVEKTCGSCHQEEVRRVSRSSMALAPRMISHTRFAFGSQQSSSPLYGTRETESIKLIPLPSESSNIGDDLLRRSCLRCHLNTKGSSRWGEHRGLGCSACHCAFPNSKDGRPRTHGIVRNTGITACLKCHNSNHVGADYVGLFEKDFQRGFRSPFREGKQPSRIYGAEHHRLRPDVHYSAGMTCIDCHTLDEIHGSPDTRQSSSNNVRITCKSCHVYGDHPAILKQADGKFLLLKGEGKTVPLFSGNTVPHSITAHSDRLECSACHAAWSFQDYGFHLMLEERADYWKWAVLSGQNDPQVQELLDRNVGTEAELVLPSTGAVQAKPESLWELPSSRDWLNGEIRPGMWFRSYSFRSWSTPPLGLNSNGRISVMRPMYQYVISQVAKNETVTLDSVVPLTGEKFPALLFNPYSPHTISAQGRTCHECHGNPKSVGLGLGIIGIKEPMFHPLMMPETGIQGYRFRWDALLDQHGNALQKSSYPNAGPLDVQTFKRLLSPTKKHRSAWYRYLTGDTAMQP